MARGGRTEAPLGACRLDENLRAAQLELDADDGNEITNPSEAIAIEGARYPDALEQRTGL